MSGGVALALRRCCVSVLHMIGCCWEGGGNVLLVQIWGLLQKVCFKDVVHCCVCGGGGVTLAYVVSWFPGWDCCLIIGMFGDVVCVFCNLGGVHFWVLAVLLFRCVFCVGLCGVVLWMVELCVSYV